MYGNAGAKPYETPNQRIMANSGHGQHSGVSVFGFAWRFSHLVSAAITAAGFYVSWKLGDPSPLMAAGLTGLIMLVALRLLRPSAWPRPHPIVAFLGGLIIAAAVALPVIAFVDDEDALFPGQGRIENVVLDARESFRALDDAEQWRVTEDYIRSEINSRID